MRSIPKLLAALAMLVAAPAFAQEPPPAGAPPAPSAVPPAPTPAATAAGAPAMPPPPPPPPADKPADEQTAAQSHSDFMDTRLSFTCTDEDMLRKQTVLPAAPGFHCGRPNTLGVLFFDNYDTRFSGFETMSHLALYKHFDKGHWDVEGGFIVRFNELAEDNIKLSDGGSYVRAAWYLDGTRASKDQIAFVAFPVSSDRMRLGYSYRISWGGSPEFFKANPDSPGSIGKNKESTPGFKLQYDGGGTRYAYVGMKSSLLLDPEINEQRSVLAFLGGAGVDVTPMIRVEANGGLFDRGKNELNDVLGKRVWLYGASLQVSLHSGLPVGSSIDYALYRNQPESIARLFHKEAYPGGLAWLVSAEGTMIGQTLKDPYNTGSTVTQYGYAGDVNVRVKFNRTRFRFDVMSRSLSFILHSIPSLPTYTDFATDCGKSADGRCSSVTPEYYLSAGVDQNLPDSGITAGVSVGLDIPATLTTPRAQDITGNQTTATTVVLRNDAIAYGSFLPKGKDVAPIFALKATLRYDFADAFAAFADVYYQYDPNTTEYDRSGNESNFMGVDPKFANFNQLGFNVTLQARF